MQRRYHIAWYDTFEAAHAAKERELEKKPDGKFQIRRKQGRYDLMERLHTNEATVVQDYIQGKSKKHPRRRMSKVRSV